MAARQPENNSLLFHHDLITIVIRVITNVIVQNCSITLVKTFADRLREAREQKQLSQGELARACGVAQGTIGNYETRVRKQPKGYVLLRMARVLGVSAEWLVDGMAPRHPSYAGSSYPNLAEEPVAGEAPRWPFSRVAPHDYWSLSPRDRALVENAVLSLMDSLRKPDKTEK